MDLEAELLKTMNKDDLEVEVKQKINSFHGFLTRDVALRLIAREKGIIKERSYSLGEIPSGEKKITFTAIVKKLWPVATYSSGKQSRVIEVSDNSGSKPLIFWNKDIELTKNFRIGDEIAVKGAYEKNNELHIGYGGKVEVVKKAPLTPLAELADGENVHVRGIIDSIEGYDSFVKGIQTVRAFAFLVSDGENKKRAVILEEPERGEMLKDGYEVLIENASVETGNIELGAGSKILARDTKNMLIGKIKSIEGNDQGIKVNIGGRDAAFDRENALKFMDASVADDIGLSTVLALKKESLLNKGIAFKIQEKDGQIVIRR